MTKPRAALAHLFEPRSIAVVGASADTGKVGYQLVEALRDFPGEVFPINPKVSEVAGRRAYPNLRAAPKVPDLVLLAVPAAASPDVLSEAAELGVGAAMIVSGGFAESGEVGAALQARIARICRDSGMRLLGPNTSGFSRPVAGCYATFVPSARAFTAGSVSIVAQSGGVSLTLAFLAQRQGIGLRLAVGLGNAVDVDAADVIEYLATDEDTNVIVVHLEGVANGRRLYDVIGATTAHKAVIVLPVGRAHVGEFAQSHTGNLMGAHATTAAAMRQAGAIVVDTTDAAIDCAAAFAAGRIPPKADPGVGILTGQAGPGLIILDALLSRGVDVPKLADATIAQVAKHLPPMTYLGNPIDTGRPSPAFADVMTCVAKDPSIDVILAFALDEPAALDPISVFRQAKETVRQPLIFATLGQSQPVEATQRALSALQTPTLCSPDRGAIAVWALVEDSKLRHRRSAGIQIPAATPSETATPARDEAAAKKLLARYGIRAPRHEACRSRAGAMEAFATLRKPLVVKVMDAAIAHKTDVGGVHLGITTPEQLIAALDRIDAIASASQDRGYLLEEMAPHGIDLILGAKRDSSFGATVLVGLGGTEAEAFDDVSIRLAPLSRVDANEMLNELRASVLLDGWRGAAPIRRDIVIDALLAVSRLITEQPNLQELDINPLRCSVDGALALDALMVWNA